MRRHERCDHPRLSVCQGGVRALNGRGRGPRSGARRMGQQGRDRAHLRLAGRPHLPDGEGRPWVPEPIVDAEAMSADAATELADDLSFALLLALDRLSPLERAAFLLHDVFDMPFADVARTLDRTEAACRQLATRARQAVRKE